MNKHILKLVKYKPYINYVSVKSKPKGLNSTHLDQTALLYFTR